MVGTSAGGLLVTGLVTRRCAGASSHFSIRMDCSVRVARAMFSEIRTTIFTSPPEFSSHHLASTLSRRRDSDKPDSKTIVGQSSSLLRAGKGL